MLNRTSNARRFAATVFSVFAATATAALAQDASPSGTLATPFEGAIEMQDEDSVLVSDLMNATVYNVESESVGKITDMIVSLDGTVEGAILGVGGFLGIGQKSVAVDMDELAIAGDAGETPRLVLNTTTDALMAAPEFVSAQQQAARAEQERLQREMDSAPSAPAPGTGLGGTSPASPPMQ
jgi:hypothetical protein